MKNELLIGLAIGYFVGQSKKKTNGYTKEQLVRIKRAGELRRQQTRPGSVMPAIPKPQRAPVVRPTQRIPAQPVSRPIIRSAQSPVMPTIDLTQFNR